MKIINPYRFGGDAGLLTNLVSWWSLNETSGTRADSHGSNDLTDNNTVLYSTGKQGNCADFVSANSEYLSVANNATLEIADGNYAFALWVTRDNQFNNVYFLTKGSLEIRNSGTGSSSKAYFQIPTSSGNEAVTSTGGIATNGAWHFIVCQHDADNSKLQISVNGSAFDEAALTGAATLNDSSLYLGARNDLAGYQNGLIDEVAFWNGRLLTSDEVTELYASGAGMAYPG